MPPSPSPLGLLPSLAFFRHLAVEGCKYFRSQRGIEVVGYLESATINTKRSRAPLRLYRNQAGYGHTGTRDDDLLASRHTLQEL